MANDESLTDDYVAGVLTRDAKESAIRYSALGLEAFSSQSKPPASKPKPNTRFLRNIIKDTDSHNAALLAKEAAESRARLQSLGGNTHREEKANRVGGGDIRRRQLGDIAAILGGRSIKRKRTERHDSEGRRVNTSSEDEKSAAKSNEEKRRKIRSRDDDREDRRSRHRLNDGDEKDSENSRHHKSSRRRHRSRSGGRGAEDRKRRRGDISGDRENGRERRRNRSRSPGDRESKKSRYRSRSPRKGRPSESTQSEISSRPRRESKPESKPDYDSDPLDEIIGPRPPSNPEIRSRGRGTMSQASGIDSRFSATYDPTIDVQLDPDEENDWDQALEALRDRQKWKSQGADRLKAAGFTDEEISKWEKGGEKREEDVKWAKKGEGREWDRGKVMGTDGVFSSSASWGRVDGATSDGDGIPESSWGRLKGT